MPHDAKARSWQVGALVTIVVFLALAALATAKARNLAYVHTLIGPFSVRWRTLGTFSFAYGATSIPNETKLKRQQQPSRSPGVDGVFIFEQPGNHLDQQSSVTLASIQSARERIRGHLYLSPARHSPGLSEMIGKPVFLKLDNLQRTGAFKERGALNKILTLTPEERSRGVIAASAGNHAQAVAYHAGREGLRSRIVMPLMTPLVKVAATSSYGADVILHGANYDDACAEALRQSEASGMTFLHPFDDDEVISGQGTIGLELLEQIPGLEAVIVPIGGGGLIAGVACAIKESNPNVRVIGVQTERLPSMLRATEAGHPVTVPAEATIADGIAVRRAGEKTVPLVKKYVDQLVTVEEEEIASAILVLLEREKTLAEGAGRSRSGGAAREKDCAQRRAYRGAGLRRQYRCHAALPASSSAAWSKTDVTPACASTSPTAPARCTTSPKSSPTCGPTSSRPRTTVPITASASATR
jgi:threonine ammonia-lyase medium form